MTYFRDWRNKWKGRLVTCPTCGAAPCEYCRSDRGLTTLFIHYERETLAVEIDETLENGLQECDH